MPSFSTISSKGQVTVPVDVRRRLGLKEGDRVEFAFEDGKAMLLPVRSKENPFTKWIGALAPEVDSRMETAVAWVREMRDPDEPE